ncbi:MAG: hypothetical protein HY282_06665 [Nitrospirae bacterium]|nr:hypothetical protein [Candidatus Manganitrophaceae bacterium]
MGFLFLFLLGISAIILLARFGSKASRRGQTAMPPQNGKERSGYDRGKGQDERARQFQEALISLLLKKEIITEAELLAEVEMLRKEEELP